LDQFFHVVSCCDCCQDGDSFSDLATHLGSRHCIGLNGVLISSSDNNGASVDSSISGSRDHDGPSARLPIHDGASRPSHKPWIENDFGMSSQLMMLTQHWRRQSLH